MKSPKTLIHNFLRSFSFEDISVLSTDERIILEEEFCNLLNLKTSPDTKALKVKAKSFDKNSYIEEDLDSNALNTSLFDFIQIAKHLGLNEKSSFADLGAGIAKAGLAIPLISPKTKVYCLEYVNERLELGKEASKHLAEHNSHFYHWDLLDQDRELPKADIYFIYLPIGELLSSILNRLKNMATHSATPITIVAIESHGELINRIKLESWLTLKESELESFFPRHDNKIYIFESNNDFEMSSIEKQVNDLESKLCASEDYEIICKERDLGSNPEYFWSANLKDAVLNLLEEDSPKLELRYPPKIMPLSAIESINKAQNISYSYEFIQRGLDRNFYVKLKDGDLNIKAGKLRKIILKDEIVLEFSKIGRVSKSKIETLKAQ